MFSGISLFQLSLICGSAISYHIEHDNLNWQSLDPSLLNKGMWLRIFCGLCSTHRGTRPQLFKDAKKIILDAAFAPWRPVPFTRVPCHKDRSKIHFRMCPHQRGERLDNWARHRAVLFALWVKRWSCSRFQLRPKRPRAVWSSYHSRWL